MGPIARGCESLVDWVGDRMAVVFVGFVLGVIGVVVGLVYLMYADSQSPEIVLRKSEWQCTGTRKESVTIYVQVGKVMVPQTTYHDVCVEYNKR